jgi:multiple sugar transport system permease protein
MAIRSPRLTFQHRTTLIPKKRRKANAETVTAGLMLAPAILLLLGFTVFPSLYSLLLSLNDWNINSRTAHWIFAGFKFYQRALTDERAIQAFATTGTFIFGTVLAEIALGTIIALFTNAQRRGSGLVQTTVLLPMMTTPVVVGLIWRLMFNTDIGWVNYLLRLFGFPGADWLGSPHTALFSVAVAEVWEWTPFIALIILASLKAMSTEPVEAARVDGAGPLQIFRFITLPYLRPSLGLCVLLRTIDSVKSFDLFYVLTRGGPGTATEVIGLYTYKQGFNFFKLPYAAALAYLTLILVVIFVNVSIFSGAFKQTR